MNYVEVQTNEVKALKAIYADDFEECSKKAPWTTIQSPSFRIILYPSEYREDGLLKMMVQIQVTMTPTYPWTLPTIEIIKCSDLHRKQQEALRVAIEDTMKKLRGRELIYEVCCTIQEHLDDYARIAQQPSLEEARLERLRIQEEEERLAFEREREKKDALARKEQERVEALVFKELKERSMNSEKPKETATVLLQGPEIVTFDRPVVAQRPNGASIAFQQVSISGFGGLPVASFCSGTSQIVRPILEATPDDEVTFILTTVELRASFWDSNEGRRHLQAVEEELERVKIFRHPNVMALYEYKIERIGNGSNHGWRILLLTQYCNMNSLADLLDLIEMMTIKSVRQYTIQILEALDDLHKSGIVHRCVAVETLVLHKNNETSEVSMKLAHPGYLHAIMELGKIHPFMEEDAEIVNSSLRLQWQPPEWQHSGHSRKSDVFQFGVCLLQMLCGKHIIQSASGPTAVLRLQHGWPDSLTEFLNAMFVKSPIKRASAFDLLTAQFLRTNDDVAEPNVRSLSFSIPQELAGTDKLRPFSRYLNDFHETAVLGRGGFGQVVKARNKLDGRIYAVKKIQATPVTLSHILHEVVLLSRLNHQYVVRYYTVWLEDCPFEDDDNELSSCAIFTDSSNEDTANNDELCSPNNILPLQTSFSEFDVACSNDFMSNSQNDLIVFANESDEEQGVKVSSNAVSQVKSQASSKSSRVLNNSFESSPSNLSVARMRKIWQTPASLVKSTLYIQMEYCENHTLSDLIKDGLYKHSDEYWRLFRQILEALSYIHQSGIIHRDLKPQNIFIDAARNIKIGDFGLARSVIQNTIRTHSGTPRQESLDDDLTTDIGTSLYAAVEVSNNKTGKYNEKVDMFSLGLIYFEMVFPMDTEMERIQTIRHLRQTDVVMPEKFMSKRFDTERKIVTALLKHNPNDRPSAKELLKSGLIPHDEKDITLNEAIQRPNSNILSQVCSTLFAQPVSSAHQVLYDRDLNQLQHEIPGPSMQNVLIRMAVMERLQAVFEIHGAVEDNEFRSFLIPKSPFYKPPTVVELLDPIGNLLQLPHDLTLPQARRLAQQVPEYLKSYSIGHVYRVSKYGLGHHPTVLNEVSFDNISSNAKDDVILQDAETIAVMCDAIMSMRCYDQMQVCVYLNHSTLLTTLLTHCGFTPPQFETALTFLGESGVCPVKSNARQNILSHSTLSATSLDLIQRIGIRERLDYVEKHISQMFKETEVASNMVPVWAYLRAVIEVANWLGVTCPIYVAPLSNHKPLFYENSIMFQLVIEDGPKRTIIAAGGRYDSLIKSFRHKSLDREIPLTRAVGFSLAVDKIVAAFETLPPARLAEVGGFKQRCQVIVSSFNEATFRSVCLEVVRLLWSNRIAADFVHNAISFDYLVRRAASDHVPYVVVVKQVHAFSASSKAFKPLRVRDILSKVDTDLSFDELIPFMLAENDHRGRFGAKERGPQTTQFHQIDTTVIAPVDPHIAHSTLENPKVDASPKVIVLTEHGKHKNSRKSRRAQEDQCREALQKYLSHVVSAPIFLVDLRDEVINAICQVSPSSLEEWKRRVVGLSPTQKAYILSTVQPRIAAEACRSPQLVLFSTKTGHVSIYDLQQTE